MIFFSVYFQNITVFWFSYLVHFNRIRHNINLISLRTDQKQDILIRHSGKPQFLPDLIAVQFNNKNT